MRRDRQELWLNLAPVILDLAALVFSFFLAYILRFKFGPTTLGYGFKISFSEYLHFLFFLIPVWILIFASLGLYPRKFNSRFYPEAARIFLGTLFSVVVSLSIIFLTKRTDFSRLLIVYLWVLSFVLVLFERIFWRLIRKLFFNLGFGQRRVLILGDNKNSRRLKKIFDKFPNLGFKVMEIVPLDLPFKKLILKIDKLKIDDIVQAEKEISRELALILEEMIRVKGITLHFIPDFYEISIARVEIDSFGGVPLLTVKKTPLEGWGRILKRIFDFVISFIVLLLFAPIFLIIAILIKIDSKGPIIFKQKRVGRDGLFNFYKFRSMVENAETLKKRLLKKNERKGPLFKISNDPRITRVGKILRKTRLDELPQFFNVLKGEMSLVGPRPHLPDEVSKYKKRHREVLTIKPGITGLAQISGASDLDFEEEVRLDTYYIYNWNFLLDIIILLKTVTVVFTGKGAV